MRNSPGNRDSGRIGYSAMRRLNGAYLLDLLRENGPTSRAELARLSGLTKPTVSSQVADLLQRGVVVEDGVVEPDERGGKPPKLLRFNPSLGDLIAVEICATEVRVRLADLDGGILDAEDADIVAERGAEHILDAAIAAIHRILARDAGRREKLMVIAVAAPGRVDSEAGVVVEAGNVFLWHNVAVRDHFQRAFSVPVVVENDVNLATLGEMHFGLGRGVQNFILIRLTTGIGAGLVLGGHIYQGDHWAAGEIGHMVFDRETAAGALDVRGFLESSIGRDRLRERLRHANQKQVESGQGSMYDDLLEAVRGGNPAAAAIVDDLESKLVLAISNLAAVMDPELIILTGDLFALVIEQIRKAIDHVIPWPVRIEQSALGDESVLLGAIGSAQELAHDLICGQEPQKISDSRKSV